MRIRSGISDRQARLLAWGGLAVVIGLVLATGVFTAAGWGRCGDAWRAASATGDQTCRILLGRNDIGGAGESLGFGLTGVLFAVLGALLGARRKDNALGWVFLATGLIFAANSFVTVYSVHAAETGGVVTAATFAAVLAEVLGGPVVFAPFVLFFLLFPSGKVLSPRWRIVVWALVASVALQTLDLALHPMPLRLAPLTTNPLGLSWLTDEVRLWLQTPAFVAQLLCLAAAVVGLVLRFRRSHGVERQQMKWFATSAALVGLTFVLAPVFWATPQLEVIWGPLFMLAIASVPVAATLAILRYRLYDLGLIINRALVYTALSALLGAGYLGLIVVLQAVLASMGGGTDIAVAASTLGVAAAFQPLRTRVQDFINRRFYRRKYDAQQTVAAFSAGLRQETDDAAVRAGLLEAVHATIAPAQAMLWLRTDRTAQ